MSFIWFLLFAFVVVVIGAVLQTIHNDKKVYKQNSFQRHIKAHQKKEKELAAKGYVIVPTESLNKYIKGAIINPALFSEVQKAISKGEKRFVIKKAELVRMEIEYLNLNK